MIIERNKDEVIIRLPANIEVDDLQRFVDYARYKEIVSKSKATQEEIDELASEINRTWWEENKSRFIK